MAGQRRYAAGGIARCLQANLKELNGEPVQSVTMCGASITVTLRSGKVFTFIVRTPEADVDAPRMGRMA